MMTESEILRVTLARRIMAGSLVTKLVRPCWVCANVGHAHVAGGCHVEGCPCCGRYPFGQPVWP
jgi:hypothetical protein